MDPADLLRSGKIGDGASDAEHAMESARGEPHRRGGIAEELAPRFVGTCDLVEKLAVDFGVARQLTGAEQGWSLTLGTAYVFAIGSLMPLGGR